MWDAPSLTVTKEIPVPNTVLGVDTWMQYLAVGSTTVELFNMNDWDWKMALTDHNQGNSRSEVCACQEFDRDRKCYDYTV